LLALSLVHAHLRQFYVHMLGDYLPIATLRGYDGTHPGLQRMRAATAKSPKRHWSREDFEHPFSEGEQRRLWENRVEAERICGLLQRMLGLVGGKFPMVMSLVPGGVTLPLTADTLLSLRRHISAVQAFVREVTLADGALLVKRYPSLKKLGLGTPDFLSVGTGEEAAVEGAPLPSGVLLEERLEPYAAVETESIADAFYDIPSAGTGRNRPAVPAPDKPDVASWVKAPRYQGRPMEVGPYARLVIAYLSGVRMWRADFVDELEQQLGSPLRQGNTVAGRLLATLNEAGGQLEYAERLLDQIDPSQPTVSTEGNPFAVSGEGLGLVEAPAGAVRQQLVLERGRVVYSDLVAASTWNGSSRDGEGNPGPLETALNRLPTDLRQEAQRRIVARIVHSYQFSATDAVH
ncbi:MAG: nickel-dependent hydrogenase large subunit, partial [Gammaproteobacteria bacterium]|nr:nickel-dependent hydrogenase large subunit [Gammaproteobacteria bacterium]